METTNNNQPMLIDGLSCVCGGSKVYYSTVNVEDMSNINQLACPNCGIIMRSPSTDENGKWLKNHWKKTHGIVKTLTAERDRNQGCEYCQPDDCCSPLSWQYGLDHIFPDYRFCPMCGRKIGGAQWL